jgi:hypothetical protein
MVVERKIAPTTSATRPRFNNEKPAGSAGRETRLQRQYLRGSHSNLLAHCGRQPARQRDHPGGQAYAHATFYRRLRQTNQFALPKLSLNLRLPQFVQIFKVTGMYHCSDSLCYMHHHRATGRQSNISTFDLICQP